MLRYAHEVELIESVPRTKRLKVPPQEFDFLTFEELSRLLEAVKDDPERRALLLLGSDAGLRQGELVALEWEEVDVVAGTLTVRRSSWHGIVGTPKSGRDRKVPLTVRLRAALRAHRHLRSELVFCHPDGRPFTQSAIEAALRFACKRAGLRRIGSHVLRPTLCSHLAMRGAAPKAIQELVGHSTLSMTLRYMHLAPSALREAIGLLDLGQQMGNRKALRFEVTRTIRKIQPRGRDSNPASGVGTRAVLDESPEGFEPIGRLSREGRSSTGRRATSLADVVEKTKSKSKPAVIVLPGSRNAAIR
jgi:hypothetical protein